MSPISDSGSLDYCHGDEWAGTRLWAVYISEAEKYDEALVEGWKPDMEGLLLFVRCYPEMGNLATGMAKAGPFSASLAAFLVENYKNLSPDQESITIALLA
ncbi:hypothetical protein FB451DRAFT_1164846 [Mycena latifolia]|nr:hypothetical protein FB451DRAFT_1164846 [Mycena latifolia]